VRAMLQHAQTADRVARGLVDLPRNPDLS
jgi:hypothetical protein